VPLVFKKNWIIIPVLAILFLTFSFETAFSFEYRFGAEVFEGVFKEDHFLNTMTGNFDQDDRYNILAAYPEVHVDFENSFSCYVLGELEWIHSWEDAADDGIDADETDADIANAFVSFTAPACSVFVGKQSFQIADGLILSSDEPGVSFEYNGWRQYFVKGDLLMAFDECPMAQVTWGFQPAFYETFAVTGAWFKDTDNRLTDLFDPLLQETGLQSSGNLFWIGGQADFFVRDVYVSFLVLHQAGEITIAYPLAGVTLDVNAYLVDIDLNYNISDMLSAGMFLFCASGDRHPFQGDLNAFLSPIPFNDRSAIFFSGGFERYDIEESVLLGGITWAGVVSPGITLDFQTNSGFVAELVGAMMFPDGDLFDRSDWIGWETDVTLSYEFNPYCRFFAEADMFRHGNFVKNIRGTRPDPAYRFVTGVNLSF
jgi:hypothetical protein